MNYRTLVFASCCILFSTHAFAELIPEQSLSDARIQVVPYDANNVVVLKSRYGYQTQIVFSNNETVETVANGDSSAWQIRPVGNSLFVKPLTSSRTDLAVITNLNSYTFQLDSTQADVVPTYKLQFIYSDDTATTNSAMNDMDPSLLNWKYSFTGNRDLAPSEAFDNGQFTYFKFTENSMNAIPAIFIVNSARKERLVNYHKDGDFIVLDTVAKEFTLRNGDEVTSVYNDNAIGDWASVR